MWAICYCEQKVSFHEKTAVADSRPKITQNWVDTQPTNASLIPQSKHMQPFADDVPLAFTLSLHLGVTGLDVGL
jgi:hypothetical protein